MTLEAARTKMLRDHLERRGITQRPLLAAFAEVPREEFVPAEMAELAYDDTPLPIGEEQTISQPYIVALTVQALELTGSERVLEVGTGSGYAAAILGRLAREVFSVERHASLAAEARERLARLGHENVHVLEGDGSLGWPEQAPFDAIAVAASAPEIPQALLEQLAPGGRLVLPVSAGPSKQRLVRVTRTADGFRQDELGAVRFVPLIGAQGYGAGERALGSRPAPRGPSSAAALIRENAERLDAGGAALEALVERAAGSRLVLLGEATHGTSEFYRARARITQALLEKGFDFVAVEADWPDAAMINDRITGEPRRSSLEITPFTRFPTWMWRNRETAELVAWLRTHNEQRRGRSEPVGFYGLDLYSMFTSIAAVTAYLDEADPKLAERARERYGSLLPWRSDPAAYGQAVLLGAEQSAEAAVVELLGELLARRLELSRAGHGARFFDATQNARLVANAERYYRAMYQGAAESWNLRDAHMFETLECLLRHHGAGARGVVWAHNSHVGDATATEMGARGDLNIGQLCRARFDGRVTIVGFGTDHGSVLAAPSWGAEPREMSVRPAHRGSYERLCHEAGLAAFLLHLREPSHAQLRDELLEPRLERAIGVVYRPETELASHYFSAALPLQFDEYVWFDTTRAVEPLPAPARAAPDLPETYPFGL